MFAAMFVTDGAEF